jgi:BCD family chlorophyll transporter-like MFS transporter
MRSPLSILHNLRLAAFPIAYGLSGALVGGTLNRVMIAELGVPASLVAFLFAIPLLISPLRVWFGYRSDGFPLLGRRREPYIVVGALLIGGGVVAAASVAVATYRTLPVLVAGEIVAFLLYGVGRNLGHNTFQALVAERFQGHQKSRALTFYEVTTLLGAVGGAGFVGRALEHFDPARLVNVALGVAGAVVVLALAAAPGQERRDASAAAAQQARERPFTDVLRELVLADPQVRRLFVVVICTFIGTLAQDVLLEPYGALVLKMSVGATTRLTMFWGLGVLTSMLLSGAVLLKWLGPLRLMRVGIAASAAVFAGVVLSGALGRPDLFRVLVAVMGLGTGLAGAGMLGTVVTFTTPVRAGLLMGVWGMANMVGHALGSLLGGVVVDLVRLATGRPFAAYATLFALEAAVLVVAFGLSLRLDFAATRAGRETPERS